ncbi:MAG: aldo/keto reductase [Chloroflexi bacterium HGW-Chloroflexi-10]|nr:MAG: aldo/keto reductase [Chloroflexi bacterium HGW-Chloroflexi-10]
MRYKLLGKSGLRVSELALGTMTFGEDWGWGASKEESLLQFNSFREAGGNFIDTAVNYTNGTSETFVGEFIQDNRDQYVVATKYSLSRNWDDPNAGGNARKNMVVSLETSLKRLRSEYIDLYYLHMWDGMTPIEEVMRALDDMVRAGKILYIGISDSPAWLVSRANMLAELRGWSQFVSLQVPYALNWRDVERDLLPMARILDLAVTVWGILDGGILTGKYNNENQEDKRFNDVKISEIDAKIVQVVQKVAIECGKSSAQVAANYIRQQQHKAQIIPVLGARSNQHLLDNLAILDWELTPEQLKQLEDATQFKLGFPHGFLDENKYIFGNTYNLIDNHHRYWK